jgi:prophage tail gpP-like protein
MTSHVVKLRVNGVDFEGFEGGEVRLGIEQLCSSFSLQYFDNRGSQAPTPIEDGDRATLLIDDRVIMDGWVDELNVEYDAKSYRATVSGRSTTCDLVDCTAGVTTGNPVKTSWSNTPLTGILADLLNPYALQARLIGSQGANFSKFRLKKGWSVGEAIARLVRPRGMVAYTIGSDLVVARAGATSTATVLRMGDQIIRGRLHRSQTDRYSHYVFKGQTRANDTVNGVNAAQLDGVVEDRGVARHRPLMIVRGGQDSKADLGQLAILERNQRAGRGERLSYTVYDWERQEGLWEPNIRVRVIDTMANVDCEMLVVGVGFRFGVNEGYVTDLELTRPEAYDVLDYPVRRRGRGIRDRGPTDPGPSPLLLMNGVLSNEGLSQIYGRAADTVQQQQAIGAQVDNLYGSGR